ncbi:MAG: DUF5995 family protein [Solirubrobacteraceae bacterium]
MDPREPIVDPIEAVAARMEAIAEPLGPDDGVRRFNELYLAVTRAVAVESASARFEDGAFISRLDVVFADLYFAAVDDDTAGRALSRAWVPLFERRAERRIAPLQFAIAGMNAHINHDLALALVTTTKEFGIELERDTPQHRDYVVVDGILERVQDEIKDRFTTGIVKDIDEAGGRVDDMLASWSVSRARDNAWMQAQTLDALGGRAFLRRQFLTALGRNVGFAGRALLLPTA